MQEYKGDYLLKTLLADEREIIAEPMDEEATHRVTGRFPPRDSVVVINGLQFIVKSMSLKQGTLNLEIRKPKTQPQNAADCGQAAHETGTLIRARNR